MGVESLVMADAPESSDGAKIAKRDGGTRTSNVGSKSEVSDRRRSSKKKKEEILMPAGFKPTAYSVVIGRGKKIREMTGNRRLRVLASSYLAQYSEATHNKSAKTLIVNTVVGIFKNACPIGAFLRKSQGKWHEVDDGVAREKVGYVFRDLLADRYESSSKSKVAKKRMGEKVMHQKGLHGMTDVSSSVGFGVVHAPVQQNGRLSEPLSQFAHGGGGGDDASASSSSSSSSLSASHDRSNNFSRSSCSVSQDDSTDRNDDLEVPGPSNAVNERRVPAVRATSTLDPRGNGSRLNTSSMP